MGVRGHLAADGPQVFRSATAAILKGLKSVLFAAAGGNLVPLVFLEKQFEPRPFVLLVVGCAL